MPKPKLSKKVVLITGATGGIGAASAKLFSKHGARLILVDLKQDALDELAATLGPDLCAAVAADVSDPDSMMAAVNAGIERFKRIDAAFLNAGVEGEFKPLTDYSLDAYDHVMAVNVRGVFLGLKLIIPQLQKIGGGSIVITSSLGGLRGTAKISAYIASKHAVVGLMKSAALENAASNIRINTINPAPIATRMMDALEEGLAPGAADIVKRRMVKGVPMRRYGQPEEVARMAMFLLSDDASFITGNSYPIDGGMSAM